MTSSLRQSRPLNHIIQTNERTLKADLMQFSQLDKTLSHIPVALGQEQFELDFIGGEVKDNDLLFEGELTFPNHRKERLPLIKARSSKDEIELEFLQDVDLSGNPKVYTYKPTSEERTEYNSLRNGLFSAVHNLLAKEYSGVKSAGLIRKRFKTD